MNPEGTTITHDLDVFEMFCEEPHLELWSRAALALRVTPVVVAAESEAGFSDQVYVESFVLHSLEMITGRAAFSVKFTDGGPLAILVTGTSRQSTCTLTADRASVIPQEVFHRVERRLAGRAPQKIQIPGVGVCVYDHSRRTYVDVDENSYPLWALDECEAEW